MQKNHNTFYWGLGGSFFILMLLLVTMLFHLLDDLNNSVFDFYSLHSPSSIPPAQRSLLIECLQEQSQLNNADWIKFISDLEQSNAGQIIFTFFPQGATETFYKKAAEMKNVYFGRNVYASTAPGEASSEELIPASVGPYTLQTAVQSIPPPRKGIYRNQYTTVPIEHKPSAPHLIRLAVEGRLGTPYRGEDIFSINFNGRPAETQPRLDMTQALAGNLMPALVSGRTVFVGLKKGSSFSGLRTPMATDSQLVSPALYTAYSFDTLLTGKVIRKAGLLLNCLVLTIVIVTGSVVCQSLKTTLAIVSAFAACTLSVLFAWLFFAFALLQLPLAELLLGQFLLLLLIVAGKSLVAEENIRTLAFNTKKQLQDKLLPDSLYNSPQYWNQIVGMVSQVLNLDRSIFLEKIPGDHRVREVAAANASIEDIEERRRDYRRTPYSTALQQNGAVEVHNFLSGSISNEQQYLSPLRIGEGEILGFWACSITDKQSNFFPDLLPMINTFVAQISEILLTRKHKQKEQERQHSPVRQAFSLDRGKNVKELEETFSLLSKRLNTVESVFDSLMTGAVLYNLFGQVVYANKKLTLLCQELQVSPYKLSSAELLVFLTGENLEEVRQRLVDLIFSGGKINFHTRKLGEQQATFQLVVRTISGSDESEGLTPDRPEQFFNISGILLELHEMTDIDKILKRKDVFFTLSSQYFHRYEVSFPPALDKLKNPELPQTTRVKLIAFLEKRLDSLFDYIERLSGLMTQNLLTSETQFFPTDFVECIQAALKKVAPETTSSKVRIDLQVPDYMVPVLAIPEELESIFQNILLYLLKDAEPNSTVTINFSREYKTLICTLTNKGYGMPDHDFQKYMTDADAALSPEFQSLQKARIQLLKYEGTFKAKSALGKGTEFTIGLKRFQ